MEERLFDCLVLLAVFQLIDLCLLIHVGSKVEDLVDLWLDVLENCKRMKGGDEA